MKLKKGIIAIIVILIIAIIGIALYFVLNNNNEGTSNENNENTNENNTQNESSGTIGSDVLVVYFSATGNTEEAANQIASNLDADIFEITPADSYTEDDLNYSDDSSRVSQEYEDESLRDVELETTEVANWDSYDTVFIGYPIWWGIAAWPVSSFVATNDFTGKTVIPFCTSASSGLGDSGDLLAETAGTGNWLEGQRFSSSPSEDDITSWLDSLK